MTAADSGSSPTFEPKADEMTVASIAVETQENAQASVPLEDYHIPYENLPRATRGYQLKATAELFEEVGDTYKRLWKHRATLSERIGALEAELAEKRRELEAALTSTGHLEAELRRAREWEGELTRDLERSRTDLVTAQDQSKILSHQKEQLKAELDQTRGRVTTLTNGLEQTRTDLANAHEHYNNLSYQNEELKRELESLGERETALTRELEQRGADMACAEDRSRSLSDQVEVFSRELAEARHEIVRSESELQHHRGQERSVAEALILARQTATELLENTSREAEQVVDDAKRLAAQLVDHAELELERLTTERAHIKTLAGELRDNLSTLLVETLERLETRSTDSARSPDEPTADKGFSSRGIG